MPVIAEYGTWRSPITAERVTAGQLGLGQPSLDRRIAYWLESRPHEGGRSVLVRRAPGGPKEDLTPLPFNVRTRLTGQPCCRIIRVPKVHQRRGKPDDDPPGVKGAVYHYTAPLFGELGGHRATLLCWLSSRCLRPTHHRS
jgi:hypothetical protein